MTGAIIFLAAYVISKALSDAADYKEPKGKHKNRYR